MSRYLLSAGVTLAFLALAGCGAGAPSMSMFTSTAGNYRILMPGTPKETQKDLPIPGGSIPLHSVIGFQSRGCECGVAWAETPPGALVSQDTNKLLDMCIQGAVSKMGASELSRSPISLDGHPGRECRFEIPANGNRPKLLGRERCYIVGDRVYEVTILAPENKADPAVSKAFFDSFALLNAVAPIVPGG